MGMAGTLAFGPSEASIGGATALRASPSARTIASAALRATLSSVTAVSASAISEPSVSSAALAAVGGAPVAASITTIVSVPATLTSVVALTAVRRATSTSLTAATAASRPGGFAPVAGVSEREVGVVTLRASPVVVVEVASLGPAVVSTAPVVASALAVVEASVSTTVVSESPVVSVTTVATLPATAATAATWSGGLATVAGVSEREVGVVTLRAGPVVVVEATSLGPAVVSTAPVVASALAVVEASVSTTVVFEPAVVSATTVAALPATAGPRFFAAVADGAAGKVGIVAFRAGPIVVGWLAPAALAVVESSISASVVSVPTVVPSALAVVAAVLASILSLLSGLFLGSNGHRDADQGVHVKRAVDVSHVSEGSVGAADDAVHLTDVGAVVGPDHDGVEGRRRAVKMHEQTTFVAFRFNRARKHPKTCLILRPSAFGVVGITQACVAEATGQHRAWRAWPGRRGTAAHRSRRQPAVVPPRAAPRKQGWECSRRVGCWHRIRPRR